METENTNLASPSGTTGVQPPVQPEVQPPVQPLEIPDETPEFNRGGWKLEELKKAKKTRNKIVAAYKAFKRPHVYNAVKHLAAVDFFRTEWPDRSPYAVYQKAQNLKNKKIFVV